MRKLLLITLIFWFVSGATAQYAGEVTYDFRDGTIITNQQSDDTKLVLGGAYVHHSSTYGLDLKVDQTISISVDGSCTVRFLGSQHSGLDVKGTATDDGDLGTQIGKVISDLQDVFDFVYSGPATTLNFTTVAATGNDLYLPEITVIPIQAGKDFTSADKNISYFFDLRDESIVPAGSPGNVTIEMGLFKIESGTSNAYVYHDNQHGIQFKLGNVITLQVAGNTKIRVAGDQYSGGTITASSTTGAFDVVTQNHATTVTYPQGTDGGPWVDFTYVGDAGTVVLTGGGSTNYIPYIELSPIPYDISLNSYIQKSGTIMVNSVDINLTSGATSADNASLTLSEGIVIKSGKDAAMVSLDLGGATPSSVTPTFSGDIAAATITNSTLDITYSDASSDPSSYSIELYDNSILHGVTSYDLRDGGTTFNAGQTSDGKIVFTFVGSSKHHGDTYGLNLKKDSEIAISVDGSSTIRFLGSQYSNLDLEGSSAATGDLGTITSTVVSDLTDTYDFTYSGPATTLVFKAVGTGSDIYLPQIDIIPTQLGVGRTSTESNIGYFFDLRDESIVPAGSPGNVTIEKGLFKIESGPSNAYGYHGNQHGILFKDGNIITLQVNGNSKIRVAGDQYSGGSIIASSSTGAFDINSQAHATAVTYPQGADGGPWVDFTYVGDAGTVALTASGSTSYIPYIEVSPITYDISLTQWIQKTGTVTINGTQIDFTSGAEAGANASITLSSGTVISATDTEANILIDLGGNALDSYTPALTGDVTSVQANGNLLVLTLGDGGSDPTSYTLNITDNSAIVTADPGVTYTYSWADGSEMPQTSYQSLRYDTFVTSDGIVTINSVNDDEAGKFGYHDSAHGGVFFPGNSFDIIVAGNAIVTFIVDTYGVAADAILEFTDENQTVLGSIRAENLGAEDGFPSSFSYTGPAGTITATIKSTNFPSAEIYMHGLSIANEAQVVSNGKIDVWDFGAEQLDTDMYNNWLDESTINSWYDAAIGVGTSGNVLPSSWSAGALSWVGGSNDRLRTTNTNLTRYDENTSSVSAFDGRIYVNAAAAVGRYMSLTLAEDDEVTLNMIAQDGGGEVHFQYVPDPTKQDDIVNVTSNGGTAQEVKFVAKYAGTYHVTDYKDKPSYYRILRADAAYQTLTGNVDASGAAGIPNGYELAFTNESGKVWNVSVANDSYSIDLPVGYTYEVSLSGANQFVVSSANTISVDENTTALDVVIIQVPLFTVSGNITGLGEKLGDLTLKYLPDPSANKIYVPEPSINTTDGSYSVELEPNVQYTLVAEGVDDYTIPTNTITITGDQSTDVQFEAKPTHVVTITSDGLTSEQLAMVNLTFTNLNDANYVYQFTDINNISLRDGTYTLELSGLDDYPLQLARTSNLTVSGAATSKSLSFSPVHNWPFNDKVIDASTPSYKGLIFTGGVKNEIAKGHLGLGSGQTIDVPMNPGEKMLVTYYYLADFSIAGGSSITTASQSTSVFETTEYVYDGSAEGFVTIAINATTYITNIQTAQIVDFASMITVGVDKDYQSINDALDAVRSMDRPNNERVSIMIDPGNYEEMIVIDIPNVSLVNASQNPSIALSNHGVDIDPDAVRITSYYGYGYNYFSQGDDNKWHADVLAVNKENGYISYENKSGSTNGSYWNATVVINSHGFIAENIILENSFNQYISKKESEDIVEEWAVGGRGTRPTDYGNTAVQDRGFVERGAALGITGSGDKTILNNCRVVGRQDSFYGAHGARVVIYRGAMMGAVDYIFGGMTAVFYKSDLVMNVSDSGDDASYLTAAQQRGERGYLMYECNVTSAEPGSETASTYRAKPGYFGRPWEATTSEVVFYNTNVETSNFPGSEGKSLISPAGWTSSLGGESSMMYEYGTVEESGVDNSGNRATWSTVLNSPTLTDGTVINTFNFTKGNDNWDPIPDLLESNADLTSLTVTGGTLSPSFDPSVTSYSMQVMSGTSITVNAMAAGTFASLVIDDFSSLPMTGRVTVTAEDGTRKEYTIDVYVLDDDNTLSSLSVLEGSLSPTFDPNTTNYTVNVPSGTSSLTVNAIANSLSATVAIGDFSTIPGSDKITVTAEDGTTRDYIISVYVLDNDNTLASLSVQEGILSPAFDASVTSYSVEVPFGTNSITVSAEANSVSATVDIGDFSVIPGSDKVTVTAEDGSTKEYTIVVTVADPLSSEHALMRIFAYPNPVNDVLNISLDLKSMQEVRLIILDLKGSEVFARSKIVKSGALLEMIDISHLETGIYLLAIDTIDKSEVIRIIKK